MDEQLSGAEVAEALKVPKQTLAQWRYLGRGPAFIKLGPKIVRYARTDADASLSAQRVIGTGQPSALAATS